MRAPNIEEYLFSNETARHQEGTSLRSVADCRKITLKRDSHVDPSQGPLSLGARLAAAAVEYPLSREKTRLRATFLTVRNLQLKRKKERDAESKPSFNQKALPSRVEYQL